MCAISSNSSPCRRGAGFNALLLLALAMVPFLVPARAEERIKMGRDTVIVWKAENRGLVSQFVVRIAIFEPKRFFEWETRANQGTTLLEAEALEKSEEFYTSKLFDTGVDVKGKNGTAIWLSRALFAKLAGAGRAKVRLDGIEGEFLLLRRDSLRARVNKEERELPALVAADDRGGEWWFLDDPNNPLLLKHKILSYEQTIASITTNRPNTLRWIKESKIKKVGN